MAAFNPIAQIRHIQEKDVDIVHRILEFNSIFLLKKNDIAYIQQNTPHEILVADSYSGYIVGVCFVLCTNNKHWITGIAADNHPPHVEVPRSLFEMACIITNNYQKETIAPAIMREYLNYKQYKLRWDIHRYYSDSALISPPAADSGRFRVIATKGTDSFPFVLHLGLANGTEKTFRFHNGNIHPYICFRLYTRNDTKAIGYGALHRNSDVEWEIGCLYAADEDGVRTLLNNMILFIQDFHAYLSIEICIIKGSVERTRLLEEAGFQKLPKEWSRYSPPGSDDYISDNFLYSDAERVIFAVPSAVYCHF